MRIEPLELSILIDEIEDVDFKHDAEADITDFTFKLGDTDTRKCMFYEIDSFGEYIEDDMDLTLIYSHGVEFTCTDTYEQLKNKIKTI